MRKPSVFLLCICCSHRQSLESDAVCAVDQAVEDGVPKGGVADQVVPVLDGQLDGDECSPTAVAVFDHFQKVAPFAIPERRQVPVVDDQEWCLGEGR